MATFVLTVLFGLLAGLASLAARVAFAEGSAGPGRGLAVLAAIFAALAAWGTADLVWAQSGHDGHQRWHHWYRTWKKPGTNESCCNARVRTPWGAETGDCEPTRAELRAGDWWAWNRQTGQWLQIPDGKLIRERNPSGEEGHLCWTPAGGVLCFVPPDTAG